MTEFQKYVFLRLGIPGKEKVQFEDLPEILALMGKTLPYENLDVMEQCTQKI